MVVGVGNNSNEEYHYHRNNISPKDKFKVAGLLFSGIVKEVEQIANAIERFLRFPHTVKNTGNGIARKDKDEPPNKL